MGKGDNIKKEAPKRRNEQKEAAPKEILFSKENYTIIGVGLVLVVIGLFLMSGGHNVAEEWKAEEIYSFTRITLAPIVILSGLSVVIFAIFKKSKGETLSTAQG